MIAFWFKKYRQVKSGSVGDDKDADAEDRCDQSVYNCPHMSVKKVMFINLYYFSYYVILNANRKLNYYIKYCHGQRIISSSSF